MTLSLQEISDRLEIQDLVYNYAAIIDQKRFGFLFAPIYHGAMRFAAVPRRELGVKTVIARGDLSGDEIRDTAPIAIVLSGGPARSRAPCSLPLRRRWPSSCP